MWWWKNLGEAGDKNGWPARPTSSTPPCARSVHDAYPAFQTQSRSNAPSVCNPYELTNELRRAGGRGRPMKYSEAARRARLEATARLVDAPRSRLARAAATRLMRTARCSPRRQRSRAREGDAGRAER